MTKRPRVSILIAVVLLVGPATFAQWRPGGQMRIVLLVDSSSATSPILNEFRAGMNGFLDALPEAPEIAIISTGSQIRIRVEPTSDRLKLRAAAARFASDGGGNTLLDTLLEADRRFLRDVVDRRSVIVILTTDAGATLNDGRIDVYNRFVEDFLSRGGRAHAIVVGGLNRGVTTQIAENLALNTGGFYETVLVATAVPKLMKTLAAYVAADL